MNKIIIIPLFALFFILIDWYVFQGVKALIQNSSELTQKSVKIAFWSITALSLFAFFLYHFSNVDLLGKSVRMFILVGIFMNYLAKVFFAVFLLIDDISRGIQYLVQKFSNPTPAIVSDKESHIPRSQFILKTAVVVGAAPLVAMSWGILSGAHDYRVRRIKLPLPNLPKAFEGLKIVQVSDIHAGSFWNKTAVQGGIEMLLNEKPDVVFFTGDLVNNQAVEMKEWISTFSKVKAPLGVFSVLGNHDYGDYVNWGSAQEKRQNLIDLVNIQKGMGWNLLVNQNHILEVDGEQIAIVGVENWGAKARFPKYGKLSEAIKGTENVSTKLLLSHDPSHWQAEVLPMYPDIDAMFSGHTHGMQMGVDIPGFKWSPVQYVYDEWAGLYRQDNRYLYVNRGFGYIGYPGRIGMPPEITTIELTRG
ncbi:metallophosphoesterase [Acidiluteibacter ferrifornacis]|uniref:Metallophosphoesterase n=1 Tax=Acidiluteibacter ferrifornacis TaxID=2692424 RepID=A0A6N9NGM2_9FLAO|nr:metallophosphoesterase [Acidiluteibacter ferrifornacis]NBG65043.1 metallophosphoesterase [Acidiluteibacter ferrifornacis]